MKNLVYKGYIGVF